MSNPIFDMLSPESAFELEKISRLIYESREFRSQVLANAGVGSEEELEEAIRGGAVDEHPQYEHYLAARILAQTHEGAREAMTAFLAEVNR